MEQYHEQYRVESARLPGWDYTAPGAYFVTLCTYDREPFFGEVLDRNVILTRYGEIVAEEWERTPLIRPSVELDEWILMPNHLHGILRLQGNPVVPKSSTLRSGSLGAILGQFKSVTTKRIRQAGLPAFAWQTRYYDRVIRGVAEGERIRSYIRSNPLRWEHDQKHPT